MTIGLTTDMNLNIPTRSFFTFEYACPATEVTPFLKGNLTGWSDANRLPELMSIERKDTYAEVFLGWSDEGLYLGFDVKGAAGLEVQPKRPLKGDGVQVWIDTRDVRNVHRASRYCHHFYFLAVGGRDDRPVAGQMRIRRARAQGKPCDPQMITVRSKVGKRGYRLSAHLPSEILTGFDPTDSNRIGFTYLIRDTRLGRQYWTADEPLPVAYDPSLWGTVTLIEGL